MNLEFLWKSPILSGPGLESVEKFTEPCRKMEAYRATHSEADVNLAYDFLCGFGLLPEGRGRAVGGAEWNDFWNVRTFPLISVLY